MISYILEILFLLLREIKFWYSRLIKLIFVIIAIDFTPFINVIGLSLNHSYFRGHLARYSKGSNCFAIM